MTSFETIDEAYSKLPYMTRDRAEFLRAFIVEHDVVDILEIGTYHGKGTAYFAAALEDLGRGHVTTVDRLKTGDISPHVTDVLDRVGLSHRVTPLTCERSYTWELQRQILKTPRPQFDLCYYDGGHNWDMTGFGFFLVDMLLKPGGWIIFDDMDWLPSEQVKRDASRAVWFPNYSQDELDTPAVRRVFEVLVPHLGYTDTCEEKKFGWGMARKPGPKKRWPWSR